MAENGTNGKTWWLQALQQVAFPILACLALAWTFNQTLQWEREQMLPVIRDNATAMHQTREVLTAVQEAMRDAHRFSEAKKNQSTN